MFCNCRCEKGSRSKNVRIGSAEKVCPRVSTLCSWTDFLGLGFLRLTVSIPMHTRPHKGPVFSTTGSSVPTPCNYTLSYHHHPPSHSSSFSLLTLLDHIIELQVLLWFQKALDLRLHLYPNLYRRLRTCIIFRQRFCICMVSS